MIHLIATVTGLPFSERVHCCPRPTEGNIGGFLENALGAGCQHCRHVDQAAGERTGIH